MLNMRSKASVKETRPCSLKIARRIGCAKSFLHEFGPFCFWPTEQAIEQLNFRKSAEEWQDHWLDRQITAAGRERVAPRFQIMRERNVAVAKRRSGVLVIMESRSIGHGLCYLCAITRQMS